MRGKSHCWLDRLPNDVRELLRTEFCVTKQANGMWTCVGKLNLQTDEVRVIEKLMGKIRKSWWFWMTTQSFVTCPTTSNLIVRQERRYPFRTENFHLHLTFAKDKDIRGNESWQPIEYSFMSRCSDMSDHYSLTDGCFTHTLQHRRGFYILRNGDIRNGC